MEFKGECPYCYYAHGGICPSPEEIYVLAEKIRLARPTLAVPQGELKKNPIEPHRWHVSVSSKEIF